MHRGANGERDKTSIPAARPLRAASSVVFGELGRVFPGSGFYPRNLSNVRDLRVCFWRSRILGEG